MKQQFLVFGILICLLCSIAVSQSSTNGSQPVIIKDSAAVIVSGDTLFHIYAPIGNFTPAERAVIIAKRIKSILKQPDFFSDSISLFESELGWDIVFEDKVIMSITQGDALAMSLPLNAAAVHYQSKLLSHIENTISSKSLLTLLFQIGSALIIIFLTFFIIKYLKRLFIFLDGKIEQQKGKALKSISLLNLELINAEKQAIMLRYLLKALKWFSIILVIYTAALLLFNVLPWTRPIGEKLFSYLFDPIKISLIAFIGYLPNLFAIIAIVIVTIFIVRFLKFIANAVHNGGLNIPHFHSEWALPTFNLVRVIVFAMMFVTIYPYIPGSDSPVFQGVSAFIAILFSIGSAGSLSNILSGIILIYTRSFKIGDRVQIAGVTGDVIEKTMLVTRLRTPKNEDITIPNSQILSGFTVNFSSSANSLGLILHTTVTIGYDVPWRKVHEMLISAALLSEGILKEPKPFVLQTSLDDFYISYQLNAYTDKPNYQAGIYSQIHQNIQDVFFENGVEILSPHYRAARDGNRAAVPDDYLPESYIQPKFRVDISK